MNTDWSVRFLALADHIAGWSKDPSTKVGCVVVDRDRRILATGYNGFPRGVIDADHRLTTRPMKHALIVHAEANAVSAAARNGVSLHGSTAYVTHPCCAQCAALLAQAGVRRVVYKGELRADWAESAVYGQMIFREACVEYERAE